MKTSDLVSVVMPAYNAERFIAEAIESVLSQIYPHWELIVVDDGCTDSTPGILTRYTDPRIITIKQENRGEGGARNSALDVARGEYVGFLDADDLYLPTTLADLVAYLSEHADVDVVYSDGYLCDEQGRPLTRFSQHRTDVYTGFILEPLVANASTIMLPCCTMVRRAAIESRSLRFDATLKYGVDWDLWTQIARFSQFGYLPKLTCKYRIHQTNMTSAARLRQRKDDLVVGRLKIMDSDWFNQLSIPTRQAFFYHLLVNLLDERTEQQRKVFSSPSFQSLPEIEQARLLRLTASNYLQHGKRVEFARSCLQEALALHSDDLRTRLLLIAMSLSVPMCAASLASWRTVNRIRTRLRAIGRRTAKPVPASLLPRAD